MNGAFAAIVAQNVDDELDIFSTTFLRQRFQRFFQRFIADREYRRKQCPAPAGLLATLTA